jgi:hypothetical protein
LGRAVQSTPEGVGVVRNRGEGNIGVGGDVGRGLSLVTPLGCGLGWNVSTNLLMD